MSDRYFAKVAVVSDDYTVVINKGLESSVQVGDTFLLVGVGDIITDPDTGEELERLELVRGKAIVTHVQNKVSTLKSSEYSKSSDTREIKKITTSRATNFLGLIGPQDSVTESIKPGESRLKEFDNVKKGDLVIKL